MRLILDGKYRESSLTPKPWEYLKEGMCIEEFFQKSVRGKKGRHLLKARYFLGCVSHTPILQKNNIIIFDFISRQYVKFYAKL